MRIALRTASLVLAACIAGGAMAACDSDPDTSAVTPPPGEVGSGQVTETDDSIGELADSASEAAEAIDAPALLTIRNRTSEVVVLTSADEKSTGTVKPGRTVKLMSERVCDWIPLTASTEDGRLIEEYTEPCRGQTWTITDQ